VAYLVALLVMIGLFAQTIYSRVPLELDVIRDRTVLYRQVENGLVENTYTLRINNMDNHAHHYRISTRSQLDFDYRGQREVKVDKGEVLTLVVRLAIDPGLLKLPSEEVIFEIESIDTASLTESQ
jgi:polyferredoxin